ncbi:hypothetical protein B0O79_1020 [Flavobacteriaceae bacterium MAR_2009_75]|nr:hypothetical protein B0O79_1020 [Flavobacteriaceae bacterium MAR_2009_75]
MQKRKYPKWYRIIRYNLNCVWYHVLMPLGQENDSFMEEIKKKDLK